MAINLNKLAQKIAKEEGGKKNLDIAQIKEVLRIVIQLFSLEKPSDVLKLIKK